jgi:hypothetical protein
MTTPKKPMVRIHNTETNEVIDREMTDIEFAEYQAHNAEIAEMEAAAKATEDAAKAKLSSLGLTIEDLRALNL